MLKFSDQFEKIISAVLIVLAMFFIFYLVVQLVWNTAEVFAKRFREVGLQYAPEYGRTVAIMFFNVLLMMEIMQTIKVFAHGHVIKARIILIVCLIAASRKILELGEQTTDPMNVLALAGLILALAIGYFLVSRYTKDIVEKKQNRK